MSTGRRPRMAEHPAARSRTTIALIGGAVAAWADTVEAVEPSPLPQRFAGRERTPGRARARPRLRRLFRSPDGGPIRARGDEPLLDGDRRRRDLRGEGPGARPPAPVGIRGRARGPPDLGRGGAGKRPPANPAGQWDAADGGDTMNLPPVVSAEEW